MNRNPKILISGGGTGGHIFPAISIANAIRELHPGAEILFVGAQGRMEMEKVPAAGYRIIGLPVSGFDRRHIHRNLGIVLRLLRSMRLAAGILTTFRPDVAVGVGGYASGPVLRKAASMGIPTLIQEQNSYAGLTNKLLAVRAKTICVAYEGMEKYFPAGKIILTGNPVREDILHSTGKREEGLSLFALSDSRPVILMLGGSLGARSLNRAMMDGYSQLLRAGYQVLWQSGSLYAEEIRQALGTETAPGLVVRDFISRMDLAYAVSDLIISRAGAGTISELCLVGKPVILVPSPNVAEDHQTKNARSLVEKEAAVMVEDAGAGEKLVKTCLGLMADTERRERLSANIRAMGLPDAAVNIASEVLKLIQGEKG